MKTLFGSYFLLLVIFLFVALIIYKFFYMNEYFENKDLYFENQEIVIARYNENLNWINEEPFNRHPIIIYNKNGNHNFTESPTIKKVVELPNVGREMHSYFYHIIENYDNLADVTIFLPGSADLPHKFERSKQIVYNIEKTNGTVFSCMKDVDYVKNNYDFQISEYLSTHSDNQEINKDVSMKLSEVRPFGKWFSTVFNNDEKNDCISFNSIIGISRKTILQKPKSYYEELMKQVNNHQNPEAVHYLERSWYSVFYPYEENALFI